MPQGHVPALRVKGAPRHYVMVLRTTLDSPVRHMWGQVSGRRPQKKRHHKEGKNNDRND